MTVTLAILLLIFENVSAQESVLVYSNTSPPDNAANVYGIVPMIEELKNTISMKLVPGSQLFDSRTALASIGGGIADAGEVISSYSRSDLKHAVILNDLKFTFSSFNIVGTLVKLVSVINVCPNSPFEISPSKKLTLASSNLSKISSNNRIGENPFLAFM